MSTVKREFWFSQELFVNIDWTRTSLGYFIAMAKFWQNLFGSGLDDVVNNSTFFKQEDNPQNPFEVDAKWICFLNENSKKTDAITKVVEHLKLKGFNLNEPFQQEASTFHFSKGKGFINVSIGFNRKNQRILQASYGPILKFRMTDSREMVERIKRKQIAFQNFFRELAFALADAGLLHGQENEVSPNNNNNNSSKRTPMKEVFPSYSKKDNPVKSLSPIGFKKFAVKLNEPNKPILQNLHLQIQK